MKARKTIVVVLAVAAAVAAGKASWKWHGKVGKAYAPHMIAGWSWGGHGQPPRPHE
jgi:hypothetical protein